MSIATRIGRAIALAALTSIGGIAAQAQTDQQLNWCNGKGGATPDMQIGGCTAAIQSGKFTGKNLAIAFYARGIGYQTKNQFDRAIQDYDQAIKLDPKHALAFNNRGLAYKSKGQIDRAIQDFDQAIRVDPRSALAFGNRGNAYQTKNQFDRAIQDLDQAIKLDPQLALAFFYRGNAYGEKGQYDRAIQDYDQAIKLNPNSANAFNNRGDAYAREKDYDHALADFGQAIKLNPKDAITFKNLGVIYDKKGQSDRAISAYDEAIRLNPEYASAFYNRGLDYGGKNDYSRAIADYGQAIRFNPTFAPAFNNRGDLYYKMKDYDHALADFTQAIKIDPKDVLAVNNRGATYFAKKDYDSAIADYSEAIRLNPNSASAFASRGNAWSNKKDYDRAVADYSEAIRLKGDDVFADLIGRASVYRESGNFSAALDDIERAKTAIASYKGSDPSPRMTYYFHKGRTLHAMGNYDAAIAAFSAGIPEQPDYYWVYYNRALSYEKTGQRDKTVEDLTTFAAHTEQKNWSDEIKAKLEQYKISVPQDKPKTANESAPKPWTMAAEVLAHLEAIKDYRELSELYAGKVAADVNWLQSAEGRLVDTQLKNWRSDAAAAVIVDDKDGRILRYSVGGVIVKDQGIAVADLEKSIAYRQMIAEAIAQNIITSQRK